MVSVDTERCMILCRVSSCMFIIMAVVTRAEMSTADRDVEQVISAMASVMISL